MTGGEILIESLKAQGIRCIVGMPGNQNIHIYDPLLRVRGIDHYLIRNEQSATLVANGYARASGQVGCALTVPGPGSTKAATGLGDALLQEADGLLSIGCRFTQIDTSNWTLSLPIPHVQFDPDPAEIGREYAVDLGVVGNLKQSLARFAEILRATNPPQNQWGDLPGRYRQEIAAARRPLPIMAAMRQLLPEDAIFSVDVTSVAYRAFDEFPLYRPRTFLYPD